MEWLPRFVGGCGPGPGQRAVRGLLGRGLPARPIRHVWEGPGVHWAYECWSGCARPIGGGARDGWRDRWGVHGAGWSLV